MRVLVACEESQTVCKAFRARGHEAYSCDIIPCSGGHPEWHFEQDASELLQFRWDLIIAHPPCTYLTNAAANHLYKNKVLNKDRLSKGIDAARFFMLFWESNCPRICVENPVPSKVFGLPKYHQIIQPYHYGHPVSKRTCLWLKGLPKLVPTNPVTCKENTRLAGNWYNKAGSIEQRRQARSKTFTGIAKAMAEQWG